MQEIRKLRDLREQDKKALQAFVEQSDRAEKEHKRRMEENQKVKTELAESIVVWDSLITELEKRNAS